MTEFEVFESKVTVENENCVTYGIIMRENGQTAAVISDVCPDRAFTEGLAEKLQRLGVDKACLLETVAEAVNGHYSL